MLVVLSRFVSEIRTHSNHPRVPCSIVATSLNASTLPKWSEAAKVLLQREQFSVLKNSFGEQQEKYLQEYVESSVMLQYNKHRSTSMLLYLKMFYVRISITLLRKI